MKKAIFIMSMVFLIIGCQTSDQKSWSEKLGKSPETFLIDNNIDTLIQGSEGTIIYIEKESFINEFGEIVADSIEIELKEIYKIEDILAQRISMMSNGQMLETGGMINMKAFSNGNELQLNNGKEVILHFPKKGNEEEMNLFYGKEDTAQIVEWELEESSTYRLESEIHIWYTKIEYLDDSMLSLVDGTNAYDTVYQHFALTKEDEEELVNKNIHANYILYDDGELEYQNITGSIISNRLRKKIRNKVKSFPQCKPYTREDVTIDMSGFFAIQSRVIPPGYKSKENYLNLLEQKLSSENTAGLVIAELQYYIFDSDKLGWMNCDRFINQSAEKVDYIVNVPKSDNVLAKIIFTDYNSVMTGNETVGKFVFEDLPLDESVKIVVLDEKKGKSLLKIVDSKITKTPIDVKDLTEYTLEELQEKLKRIK